MCAQIRQCHHKINYSFAAFRRSFNESNLKLINGWLIKIHARYERGWVLLRLFIAPHRHVRLWISLCHNLWHISHFHSACIWVFSEGARLVRWVGELKLNECKSTALKQASWVIYLPYFAITRKNGLCRVYLEIFRVHTHAFERTQRQNVVNKVYILNAVRRRKYGSDIIISYVSVYKWMTWFR